MSIGNTASIRRRLVALCVALVSPIACAAIWGYVDADGVAHVAKERMDDRYQLFFKGEPKSDPAATFDADADVTDAFLKSSIYRRIVGEPNIERFDSLIARNAKRAGLDPALVKALIAVESAFDPAAVSGKGALGLMQVIPETGVRYGVAGDRKKTVEQKLLDPVINLDIGTRYLSDLLTLYANDIPLALAAYNAGEQAVSRYNNQVPPYPETQQYVKLVQQFHKLYRPASSVTRAPSRITLPASRSLP